MLASHLEFFFRSLRMARHAAKLREENPFESTYAILTYTVKDWIHDHSYFYLYKRCFDFIFMFAAGSNLLVDFSCFCRCCR